MYHLIVTKILYNRIYFGKLIGLTIGTFGFFIAPLVFEGIHYNLRFAILFWYITFGAIIGSFGYLKGDYFLLILPKYQRAMFIGAWLNFIIMLFLYEPLSSMLGQAFINYPIFQSPLWLIAEGVLMGLIIEFVISVNSSKQINP
jgi:hypothetical protein